MRRISLLLLFFLTFIGCKDNEKVNDVEDMFLTRLRSAPLVEGEDLPDWLSFKIEEIERQAAPKSLTQIRIYQGEWENEVVYFITNDFYSCLFCEIYYKNGEHIALNSTNVNEFSITSSSWTYIYEYGDSTYWKYF